MMQEVAGDRPGWLTLRRSSDVECVFRRGQRLRSDAVLIICHPQDEGVLRVAFLTAKGLGNTVRRNRQRRRLREAFRRLWPDMDHNSADLLLMALPPAERTAFRSLVDTTASLLARAGLLPHDAIPAQ